MKKESLAIILLVFVACSSCSSSLNSTLYETTENKEGIVYSLPKNLIKVEITYTVKTPYELVNGIEHKLNSGQKISIDKPINILSTLEPNEDEAYVLSGSRISNNFFTKSNLDLKLSKKGLLTGIEVEIDDQSTEFGENLIISGTNLAKTLIAPTSQAASEIIKTMDSVNDLKTHKNISDIEKHFLDLETKKLNIQLKNITYDTYLFDEIRQLNQSYINNYNKDSIAIIKSKITHLTSQLQYFQLRNKTFYKSKELKYTALIDPFKKYSSNEISTSIINGDTYNHKILPQHIFPKNLTNNIPKIEIQLVKKNTASPKLPSNVEGIVVRNSASTTINLKIDDALYGSEVVFLAQLGNISTIPVKSKRAGKIKTSIKFNEFTGAIAQHTIEADAGSDKVGKSLVKSSETLQETIDYLKYQKGIKELEALKGELTLNNEIYGLSNQELTREFNTLTDEQKILTLKKTIDELKKDETDPSEFDKKLKELQDQQAILNLELAIKQIKDQLKEE